MLVFLGTDLPDAAKAMSELEPKVFGDENVAVGARLFRSIRLKGDKIAKEHPHWQTLGGRELPRVIVVDANGQKSGTLEGKELSASNLFKTMKKAASKTYKADLDKIVKETSELLDEMDRIEAKQKVLAEQKKTANGKKAEQIAEEEQALVKQLKDVQARDSELLKKATDDRKVAKG
jgi:hypothetical protein